MRMKYTDALKIAIDNLNNIENKDDVIVKAIEKLTTMRSTMIEREDNRKPLTAEAKKALSEKRKAETAAKRADLMAVVLPVIRGALTDERQTAKDIFLANEDRLPKGYTDRKVQYVLLHELLNEVEVIQIKGEPNYYMKKKA